MKQRILSLMLVMALCLTMLHFGTSAAGLEEDDTGAYPKYTDKTEDSGQITEKATEQAKSIDKSEESEKSDDSNQPDSFEETDVPDESEEIDKAVLAVQALIDALPGVEEVKAMDTDSQEEVYLQTQNAYDAYMELTEEQLAMIEGAEILDILFDFFNSLIMPLPDSVVRVTANGVTTGYESIGDAWTAAVAAGTATVTLLDSVETDKTLEIEVGKKITLDLNGCNITMTGSGSVISVGGDFTLNDSKGNGIITGGSATNGGGVRVYGIFTMNGGIISGNTANGDRGGGGVYINDGIFTMNGGVISNNTVNNSSFDFGGGGVLIFWGTFTMENGMIIGNTASCGGGVSVLEGRFYMNGGTISGNTATEHGGGVNVNGYSTFTMNGGTISENTAKNGGGVCVWYGIFTMNDGTISGNIAAFDGGGGVFVWDGTFTMQSGMISDNTADCCGGGVRFMVGNFTMQGGTISGNTADHGGGVRLSNSTFTMQCGMISDNTADYCGGVLVDVDSIFTMQGGTISGNTAEYGGGVYVEDSIFTMENGMISSNTAINKGGGVYVEVFDSVFTMQGGFISDNTADNGGGVYVKRNKTFTMENGTISGNTAISKGGGVYVDNDTFNVSGAVNITGNTVGGAADNVFLTSGRKINIVSSLKDAHIGVTLESDNGIFTTGYTSSGNDAAPKTIFSSDNPKYDCIFLTDDGEAALGNHNFSKYEPSVHEPEFNWTKDYSSVTATFICANDNSHTVIVKAVVTSEVTKPATSKEKGVITYTATVEFEGKTYTDTRTKDIDKLDPPSGGTPSDTPKTGDHSELMRWSVNAFLSLIGAAMVILSIYRRRRSELCTEGGPSENSSLVVNAKKGLNTIRKFSQKILNKLSALKTEKESE